MPGMVKTNIRNTITGSALVELVPITDQTDQSFPLYTFLKNYYEFRINVEKQEGYLRSVSLTATPKTSLVPNEVSAWDSAGLQVPLTGTLSPWRSGDTVKQQTSNSAGGGASNVIGLVDEDGNITVDVALKIFNFGGGRLQYGDPMPTWQADIYSVNGNILGRYGAFSPNFTCETAGTVLDSNAHPPTQYFRYAMTNKVYSGEYAESTHPGAAGDDTGASLWTDQAVKVGFSGWQTYRRSPRDSIFWFKPNTDLAGWVNIGAVSRNRGTSGPWQDPYIDTEPHAFTYTEDASGALSLSPVGLRASGYGGPVTLSRSLGETEANDYKIYVSGKRLDWDAGQKIIILVSPVKIARNAYYNTQPDDPYYDPLEYWRQHEYINLSDSEIRRDDIGPRNRWVKGKWTKLTGGAVDFLVSGGIRG